MLPAQASAKFSFRLVGSQDPHRVAETFRAFVKDRLPADCRAEFLSHGASGAVQLPFSSEALSRARRALQAEWGKEPDDRFRPGGRSHPLAEREIRAFLVSQRNPKLGAGFERVGPLTHSSPHR